VKNPEEDEQNLRILQQVEVVTITHHNNAATEMFLAACSLVAGINLTCVTEENSRAVEDFGLF
jgi:hypothetical protein